VESPGKRKKDLFDPDIAGKMNWMLHSERKMVGFQPEGAKNARFGMKNYVVGIVRARGSWFAVPFEKPEAAGVRTSPQPRDSEF